MAAAAATINPVSLRATQDGELIAVFQHV